MTIVMIMMTTIGRETIGTAVKATTIARLAISAVVATVTILPLTTLAIPITTIEWITTMVGETTITGVSAAILSQIGTIDRLDTDPIETQDIAMSAKETPTTQLLTSTGRMTRLLRYLGIALMKRDILMEVVAHLIALSASSEVIDIWQADLFLSQERRIIVMKWISSSSHTTMMSL